ncbi:hypothetical protein OHA72_29130 [Dactylosporangium sp. NBC_01737]|uniref:effector-associated constant component EACC1 n=1 Tax=Dactylosporangium sp. NBC_01737 TaxID=2975959 RepID=UPI002E0FD0B1|nr:hypothetical protein OHA72_29130 [Dactylosporangium sp. NBC_01737]
MDISLEVDDEESLRMLYRWLRDDEIRRTVPVTMVPTPPRPGEMGAAFEIISAVVSNGIALGGLLVAVASWRGSRPRPPRVRIRHGATVVELDGSPDEIRRVVDALDPPAPAGEPPADTSPAPRQDPAPRQNPAPQQDPAPRQNPAPRPDPTPDV